jgi:predicted acetyltransferase
MSMNTESNEVETTEEEDITSCGHGAACQLWACKNRLWREAEMREENDARRDLARRLAAK